MSKKIHGVVYHWVDTIFDDDFIYDVFENAQGHKVLFLVGERG